MGLGFSAVAMPRWRIVRLTGVAGMGFIRERDWRAVCGRTISGREMGAMGIIFARGCTIRCVAIACFPKMDNTGLAVWQMAGITTIL